ncbi:MAG: DNA-processing protein DprA, partial [Cyanobacteria bacterium P01_A01_bin.135]
MSGVSRANTERPYWVAWSQIPQVGPVRLQRLWQHFGNMATAWQADLSTLMAVEGIGLATAMEIDQGRSQIDVTSAYRDYAEANPQFWTPSDADYPRLLLEIPDPPPLLHYRGQVNSAENQAQALGVAIVGTRQPTEYGRRWTYRIAQALARAGVTVISGLADGI